MKRFVISLAVLTAVLFAGFTVSAQRKSSPGVKAIDTADREWARVFGAKDLKRSVDACTDNALVLGPGAPVFTGKKAIGELFSSFFALPDFKITWHPTQVEVARSGELGYSTGVYEMSFKDPTGKVVNDRGKYVTIWKKQANGKWKVINDIFNSDSPPPR